MAFAKVHIGLTNWAADIVTGRHSLISDEPAALGGEDAGPSPFQLLLASLGSCTAITLRMYAERKGWPLEAVDIDLHYRAEGEARSITRALTLQGDLDEAQRARLADIAERTPVTLALKGGVAITTTLA
ncbi:putative redox protein [Caulobacter ginsengisoli]|uniref:Redox protein n=1 Tax=Caulobacter ginsengisoli TaxID=400775 RepID=A0ABU0IZJ1_9CAUL|nr:OsmC family protein [Caulobacter ginsengisoli]MDQ0466770.1 putative redox protein [Caulobacter ginsengisoli]